MALVVAGAALVAAGCGQAQTVRNLPDGSYAGSNAANQAVTVGVGGGRVEYYDGHKVQLAAHGAGYDRKDRVTLLCRSAFKGTELECQVQSPTGSESVELMKL
jgi:hypothetical protein